jgi:endonuclease III
MKNSKEYAQRLQRLYRGLKRAHPKVEKTSYDDPIEALVYGVVSERISETATQRAMKGFRDTFVDWNDLRVSRVEEIVEVLREDTAASRATAFALTTALRAVFDEYHTLSLQNLKKIGKRPAKQALEGLDGMDAYVIGYCMLTSLQGHAIPLTGQMADYLRQHEVVDPEADEQDIEGFLTRQVAAKNAYEFYALLRRESESPRVSKSRKKTTATRKKAKTRKVAKAKK